MKRRTRLFAFVTLLLAILLAIPASATSIAEERTPDKQTLSETITKRATDLIFQELGSISRSSAIDTQANFSLIGQEVDSIIREEYVKAGWQETSTGPQTASEVWEAVVEEVDPKAIKLAYMDLSQAPANLHDYILSARREIIYRFDWQADMTADNIAYGSVDNAEAKTFEIKPRFSELFPGWYEPRLDMVLPDWKDAPVFTSIKKDPIGTAFDHLLLQPLNGSLSTISDVIQPRYGERTSVFDGRVYLNWPSSSSDTGCFTIFGGADYGTTKVYAGATKLDYSENYNLGLTDMTTATSITYWTNLVLGQEVTHSVLRINQWCKLGMRASTYSNPGYSTLYVDESVYYA